MNPELLLTHFNRISDSPDAVPRLRSFVIDLAVRGKLVEQDSNDEPGLELLRRIQSEKARLAESGAIRVGKSLAAVEGSNLFHLPAGWVWTRWDAIALKIGDIDHKMPETVVDGVPFISPRDFLPGNRIDFDGAKRVSFDDFARLSKKIKPSVGDLIYPRYGTIGENRLVIEERDFLVSYSCAVVKVLAGFVDAQYQYFYSVSTFCRDQARAAENKTTQANVGIKSIQEYVVPLPPLAEQRRIVAKVNELMSLCDRLQVARLEREKRRDQLIAGSLHNLNNGVGSELFREHAHFCIANVPALINRSAHIQQFRQTVLNLAVRGRLVEQYSSDEPASELLKRFRADRGRMLEEGKIKGHKELPPIEKEEAPFSIPPGWQWGRFIEVAAIQSNLVSPSKYEDSPHVAPDNIESGTGRLLPYTTVRASAVFSAKHLFFGGCILYSKIRPALAKAVIVDFDGLCSADMYPILPFIRREYLHKYMLSEAFVRQSISEDNRVAMPKINQIALAKIAVPVPPLAEQDRIVAKVNELMELCDRLEGQLTAAHSETHHLLESVLHHALRSSDQVREDGKR